MEQLENVPLAVADTRPAMVPGLAVPLEFAVLLLAGGALIVVFLRNPLYALVMVPLWLLGRELIKYDYNAARIARLWLNTSARSVDARWWGGASPAPYPVRHGTPARGIADAG